MSAREEALPYYKWLWRDFRSNRKVQRMGWVARGLYRELIDEAWAEGSIPNDMTELADICGCPVEAMAEVWPRIEVCWRLDESNRWVSDKLESLRTEVDTNRVTKARAGRIGGLTKLKNKLQSEQADVSKVEQKLADAKHVLEPATECHIAEHKQEHKQSKSRVKTSGEETPGDVRHNPFKLEIFASWHEGEPSWNGREGSALSKLLAANPRLTLEGFKRLLKHRRDSEGVNLSARPYGWLEKVTDYGSGPLDRYGKPLQLVKPTLPQLRGVTLEEAMQR